MFLTVTGSARKTLRGESCLLRAGANLIGTVPVLCRDSVFWRPRVSSDGTANDQGRETKIQGMEKRMTIQRFPETDSIRELAEFWNNHDLTEFQDQLEEVKEPVFIARKARAVRVVLKPSEIKTLRRLARSRQVDDGVLLRQWIVERLHTSATASRPSSKPAQQSAGKIRRR